MLFLLGHELPLYFESGTRRCYLNPFRLKRRPDALEVNSREGALFEARLLVSRVPQELTKPLLWSISNIYSGVWSAVCLIFVHQKEDNSA